jgi:hypothetical protein
MKELLILNFVIILCNSLKLTTFEAALNAGAISDTKSHDILKILKLDKGVLDNVDIREEDLLKHKSI